MEQNYEDPASGFDWGCLIVILPCIAIVVLMVLHFCQNGINPNLHWYHGVLMLGIIIGFIYIILWDGFYFSLTASHLIIKHSFFPWKKDTHIPLNTIENVSKCSFIDDEGATYYCLVVEMKGQAEIELFHAGSMKKKQWKKFLKDIKKKGVKIISESEREDLSPHLFE